jgi:hypothetical protein
LNGITALDLAENGLPQLLEPCGEGSELRVRPRLLFLDTEFTNVEHPELISIGLVSETGEKFYEELSDGWEEESCSPMVVAQVLPLLRRGKYAMDRKTAGRRMSWWLEGFLIPVRIVIDNAADKIDWLLMRKLVEDFNPGNLYPVPFELFSLDFYEMESLLIEAKQKGLAGTLKHHALHDAEVIRSAWNIIEMNYLPELLEPHLRK